MKASPDPSMLLTEEPETERVEDEEAEPPEEDFGVPIALNRPLGDQWYVQPLDERSFEYFTTPLEVPVADPIHVVIWGQEYGEASGGVRSLNRLCHWLNVLGQNASIANVATVHPDWEVKLWDGDITDDTIAFYPEPVHGNPIGARRVVRWVLYYPGQRNGPEHFEAGERVYHWAKFWAPGARAASADGTSKPLHVSIFEPDIIYPWNGPKFYDAFWIGRGFDVYMANRNRLDTSGMIELHPGDLDHLAYRNRHAFMKVLRRARDFYTFDPITMLIPEGIACGANTYIVNMDGSLTGPMRKSDPLTLDSFDDPYAFLKPGDVVGFIEDMRAWT